MAEIDWITLSLSVSYSLRENSTNRAASEEFSSEKTTFCTIPFPRKYSSSIQTQYYLRKLSKDLRYCCLHRQLGDDEGVSPEIQCFARMRPWWDFANLWWYQNDVIQWNSPSGRYWRGLHADSVILRTSHLIYIYIYIWSIITYGMW